MEALGDGLLENSCDRTPVVLYQEAIKSKKNLFKTSGFILKDIPVVIVQKLFIQEF